MLIAIGVLVLHFFLRMLVYVSTILLFCVFQQDIAQGCMPEQRVFEVPVNDIVTNRVAISSDWKVIQQRYNGFHHNGGSASP